MPKEGLRVELGNCPNIMWNIIIIVEDFYILDIFPSLGMLVSYEFYKGFR